LLEGIELEAVGFDAGVLFELTLEVALLPAQAARAQATKGRIKNECLFIFIYLFQNFGKEIFLPVEMIITMKKRDKESDLLPETISFYR
jgi:hypothetical protein